MQILISFEASTDYVKAEWYTEGETLTQSFPSQTPIANVLREMYAFKLREQHKRSPSRPRSK